jgi:Flp pilus assembly pilin Flp
LSKICQYLKDEQGIETLEWIAIGVLILGVAFVVYPGALQTGLTDVVDDVVAALTGAAAGLTP